MPEFIVFVDAVMDKTFFETMEADVSISPQLSSEKLTCIFGIKFCRMFSAFSAYALQLNWPVVMPYIP